MSRHLDLCRSACSMLPTSTLPLSKEGILHHSKFVPEEHKLPFNQGFGQNIYNLLICGNILKLHCSLLDPISDEVISICLDLSWNTGFSESLIQL
jgi:hypothetical protein